MTEDKFKWDENNVTELLYHLSKKTNWVHSQMCKWAEDFKQSKLQSQDKQIGWEIVEFKTKDGHLAIKQSEPRFGLHWRVMKGESIGWCSYSTCIEDYNIHSVKRLSDGEVFTVGDKVESYFGGGTLKGKIKSIDADGFINCSNDVYGGNDWSRKITATETPSKITKPTQPSEDKPVIIEDNDRCGICGGEMVYIRGRYPNTDKRKVCPTCTTERLEQISDLCSPEYGKAYQNKN